MAAKRHLTERLLHLLAITLAVAAILAGWVWVHQFRTFSEQDNAIDQQRILQKTSQQVNQLAREVKLALGLADSIMAHHPDHDPRTDPLIQSMARQFHDETNGMITLRVLDRQNQITFPREKINGPLHPGPPTAFFQWLRKKPVGSVSFSNPVFNSETRQWNVIAGRLLQHQSHGIDIVYVAFDMNSMTNALGLTGPGPDMAIQLTGTDGTVLAHWPASPGLIGKNIKNSLLMQAASQQSAGQISNLEDTEGETFTSFMHDPNHPLILSVSTPRQAVEEPIADERQRIILAVTIFILTEVAAIGWINQLLGKLRQRQQRLESELVDKIEHVTALDRHAAQLESAKSTLERLSQTDPLTSLYNRRHFMDVLAQWLRRYAGDGQTFCMVYLDIDHFKAINDQHGHAIGDEVLIKVASLLQTQIRPGDLVARIGGEEFGLLLPETSIPQAVSAMERIRQALGAHTFDSSAGALHITFSAGVSLVRPGDSTASLMQRADQALYQAKTQGRNRVLSE
ncbi:hypothetical protein THUN1379_08160 [Paludibacterium sp. THUN1379]|uniref:diguanylate cyclase n=1 Tax=Paludibacterium sp. THUN1379 TaxID=3112107 RepID=UPI0030864721|nr:hypothetical protein THUN1379_08160 [Paludibacterium sp. THUN1379]